MKQIHTLMPFSLSVLLLFALICNASQSIQIISSEDYKNCEMKDFNELLIFLCTNEITFTAPTFSEGQQGGIRLRLLKKVEGQHYSFAIDDAFFMIHSSREVFFGNISKINTTYYFRYSSLPAERTPLNSKLFLSDRRHSVVSLYKNAFFSLDLHENELDSKYSLGIQKIGRPLDYFSLEINTTSNNLLMDFHLYRDFYFGNEYLFLGFENRSLAVYKSFYEDTAMIFKDVINLDRLPCISEIVHFSKYLFVLCKDIKPLFSPNSTRVFLQIFKIDVSWDAFRFREQCVLQIDEQEHRSFASNSNASVIDVKIKKIGSRLMIMVNLAGSKINVYSIELPNLSDPNSIVCPQSPVNSIYAQDLSNSSSTFQSFSYYTSTHRNLSKDGFILSFTNGSPLYFLPYCFTNRVLDGNHCMVCPKTTYSFGGNQSSCTDCTKLVPNGSQFSSLQPFGYDYFLDTCPLKCEDPLAFGSQCEPCQVYRNRMHAELPKNAVWDNQSKACGFKCLDHNYLQYDTICVTYPEITIIKNKCRQIQDCYNCSATESCVWCDGACNDINSSKWSYNYWYIHKNFISSGLADFFLECQINLNVCNGHTRSLHNGTIRLLPHAIYRNTYCHWVVNGFSETYENTNFRIEIKLSRQMINDPSYGCKLMIHFCKYVGFAIGRCQSIWLNTSLELQQIEVSAFKVEISLLFKKNLEDPSQLLEISYTKELEVQNGYKSQAETALLVILLLLSICMCCKFTYQVMRHRRGIMWMDNIESDQDLIELSSESSNAARINRELVREVKYDKGTLNHFDQKECCICLEAFTEEQTLALLVCKHLYHSDCFENWVSFSETDTIKCPICIRALQ